MEDESPEDGRSTAGEQPVAPWKRRDDETPKAHDAFRRWLLLAPGDRSLAAAARFAGHKQQRYVERWSSAFDWQNRARAYDERNDDRADAAAAEAREALMRRVARERVAYQLAFHEFIQHVPGYLNDIAKDPDQPAAARVNASRILIEQGGYTPEQPIEQTEGIGEIVVAELLRTSAVLGDDDRALFNDLLNRASVIREQQRAAGDIDEPD